MKAKVGLLLLFVKSVSQMFLPGERSWSAEIADNRANHSNHERTEQFARRGCNKRLKLTFGLHHFPHLELQAFSFPHVRQKHPHLHTPAPYPWLKEKEAVQADGQ